CCNRMAAFVLLFSVATADAEVASIYGGSDGLCGHKTASGERLNCAAMTAAHRRLPFGTQIRVCHSGCFAFSNPLPAWSTPFVGLVVTDSAILMVPGGRVRLSRTRPTGHCRG